MNFHTIEMLLCWGPSLTYIAAAGVALVGSKVPVVREIFPERFYRTAMTFACFVWPFLAIALLISGPREGAIVVAVVEVALIVPLRQKRSAPTVTHSPKAKAEEKI